MQLCEHRSLQNTINRQKHLSLTLSIILVLSKPFLYWTKTSYIIAVKRNRSFEYRGWGSTSLSYISIRTVSILIVRRLDLSNRKMKCSPNGNFRWRSFCLDAVLFVLTNYDHSDLRWRKRIFFGKSLRCDIKFLAFGHAYSLSLSSFPYWKWTRI